MRETSNETRLLWKFWASLRAQSLWNTQLIQLLCHQMDRNKHLRLAVEKAAHHEASSELLQSLGRTVVGCESGWIGSSCGDNQRVSQLSQRFCFGLVRLVGYHDWSDTTRIVVYLGEAAQQQQLDEAAGFRRSLVEHVSKLVKLILLNQRPAQPAQSRWTGVPCVARFAFGLFAFHGLLAKLIQSLPGGTKPGKGKGGRGRGRGRGNGKGGKGRGSGKGKGGKGKGKGKQKGLGLGGDNDNDDDDDGPGLGDDGGPSQAGADLDVPGLSRPGSSLRIFNCQCF